MKVCYLGGDENKDRVNIGSAYGLSPIRHQAII